VFVQALRSVCHRAPHDLVTHGIAVGGLISCMVPCPGEALQLGLLLDSGVGFFDLSIDTFGRDFDGYFFCYGVMASTVTCIGMTFPDEMM